MLIDPDGREIRNSKGEDISTPKHEKETRWTENHIMLNHTFGDPSGFTSLIMPKLEKIRSVTQRQHDEWLNQNRSTPYIQFPHDVTQTNKNGDVFLKTNSRKKPIGNGRDIWEQGCPMLYRVNNGDQIFALTPVYMKKEVNQGWMTDVELVLNPTDAQFQEFLKVLNEKIASIENDLTEDGYGNFTGTLTSSVNAPNTPGIKSYMMLVVRPSFLPLNSWIYGISITGTKTIEFYNYK